MKKHLQQLVIYLKKLKNPLLDLNMFICLKILDKWLYLLVSIKQLKSTF